MKRKKYPRYSNPGLAAALGFFAPLTMVAVLSIVAHAQVSGVANPSASPGVDQVQISPNSSASTSPSPNSGLSSPEPVPPAAKLGTVERKRLLREFRKAQWSELQALRHQHRMRAREIALSHRARMKDWEAQEKVSRRKFFEENEKGPERRAYVQEYKARYNVLKSVLDQEKASEEQQRRARVKSLREDQALTLKEFKEFIRRGEVPPETLWPQPGS